MSAMMISRFTVKNPEKFQAYMQETRALAQTYGAEAVFAGKTQRVLNGEEENQQVVVVRFPDIGAINEWFDSDAYNALLSMREEAADMTMVAYS